MSLDRWRGTSQQMTAAILNDTNELHRLLAELRDIKSPVIYLSEGRTAEPFYVSNLLTIHDDIAKLLRRVRELAVT